MIGHVLAHGTLVSTVAVALALAVGAVASHPLRPRVTQ